MKLKKTFYLIIPVAILILVVFFSISRNESGIKARAYKIEKGNISKNITLSGSIESLDSEEITIPAGSKILEVFLSENDMVKAGDIIALLDTDSLTRMLKKAEISLEDLESDLYKLESSQDIDREIVSNELMKAQEEYDKAIENLESAKLDMEKNKTLYEENAISKSHYEDFVETFESEQSKVGLAFLNLENRKKNLLSYDLSKTSTIESLKRQIESVKLDIEDIKESIADGTIKSSISGILSNSDLKKGRRLSSTSTLLINSTKYRLTGYSPQEDALVINEGDAASITVKGIDKKYEGNVTYKARKAVVEGNGNMTPKTEIIIGIDTSDEMLYPGLDADAEILVEEGTDLIIARRESVRYSDTGSFVFTVSKGKAIKTSVKTGIYDDFYIEITEGLDEGSTIIENPTPEIKDGIEIILKEE